MTWWIAFTIAVLGWYFTARQNAKNSARTLINQEINEARSKLHELIVACSKNNQTLPVKPMAEEYVKMQSYIASIQELERLYSSYHSPCFRSVRVIKVIMNYVALMSRHNRVKNVVEFLKYWLIPPHHAFSVNNDSHFELNVHISNIRQSLTDDKDEWCADDRLNKLSLEYKKLCIWYQHVI